MLVNLHLQYLKRFGSRKTKSNSSSDTDSDNNGDTADSSDSVDDTSDDNDNSQTSYDWSKNTTGNANLAADQTVVMENGTYQLIAVTTRDDDMFYVIIDKTKKENNVYFLNEVDTADLDKLANDDSNVSNGDSSTETTAPADEDADTETATQNDNSSSNSNNSFMLYLVLGIAILGGIGFAFFKLKGKDGKRNLMKMTVRNIQMMILNTKMK